MKDLLMNLLGITETKIATLDIMIKLAKKQDGIIYLEQLETIKEGLIKEAGKKELDDAFERSFGEKNG